MKMKVLHLDDVNYPKETLKKLQEDFIVKTNSELKINNRDELKNHLSDNLYDIIFVKLGYYFGKDLLQNQKKLKYIVSPTTGHNHLDIEFLNERGILIVSLKGEFSFLKNIQSTSEHVWSLILYLAKKLEYNINKTRSFRWDRHEKSIELNNKNIGIIGYGRLGKLIHKYADAFNMNILINDLNLGSSNIPLKELLKTSDIIVLLIDYRKENENFIDNNKFNLMKKGVIFINCSRGEHVNEDHLLIHLKNNKIGACALDVLKDDSSWASIPKDNKLINYSLKNNNLVITPHVGGYSDFSIFETRKFITNKLYQNFK